MYAQNNIKVYTLRPETFSLSEQGIISRHLKSTLAAVGSAVCIILVVVFLQNYTSTVRVKELDKRTLISLTFLQLFCWTSQWCCNYFHDVRLATAECTLQYF